MTHGSPKISPPMGSSSGLPSLVSGEEELRSVPSAESEPAPSVSAKELPPPAAPEPQQLSGPAAPIAASSEPSCGDRRREVAPEEPGASAPAGAPCPAAASSTFTNRPRTLGRTSAISLRIPYFTFLSKTRSWGGGEWASERHCWHWPDGKTGTESTCESRRGPVVFADSGICAAASPPGCSFLHDSGTGPV